jgi:hypothetical protein
MVFRLPKCTSCKEEEKKDHREDRFSQNVKTIEIILHGSIGFSTYSFDFKEPTCRYKATRLTLVIFA